MSNESDEMKFERMLKSVPPRAVRVDPVAAAFAAGRGSARRQLRVWQSLAGVMLFVGVAGVLLNVERRPAVDQPSVLVVAAQGPTAGPLPAQSLIMLQQSVREKGLDGLPVSYVPASTSVRSVDSL